MPLDTGMAFLYHQVWLRLVLRPANPKLTFGGWKEPKKKCTTCCPRLYPATFNVLPSDPMQEVLDRIYAGGASVSADR